MSFRRLPASSRALRPLCFCLLPRPEAHELGMTRIIDGCSVHEFRPTQWLWCGAPWPQRVRSGAGRCCRETHYLGHSPCRKGLLFQELSFHGIPIKAHAVVSDEALYAAYDRLAVLLEHLPVMVSSLVAARVQLHIIGKDQVTTDLPEWRQDKGKPLSEYNGLTRDQRTRGMGGRLVSCGEEDLLQLPQDGYRGRDICLHEFSHAIRNQGMSRELREKVNAQYHRSLAKGLWVKSYAALNPDEFFAELTMWYFGTHGDRQMNEPKPRDGPAGLKEYDAEAFGLFDDFYQGRLAGIGQPADALPEQP